MRDVTAPRQAASTQRSALNAHGNRCDEESASTAATPHCTAAEPSFVETAVENVHEKFGPLFLLSEMYRPLVLKHEKFGPLVPQQLRPQTNTSDEGTCKISLVFSPIGDKPVKRLLNSSVGIISSLTPEAFMHWEVHCEWSEKKRYKFEALNNRGVLTPLLQSVGRSSEKEYYLNCGSTSGPGWLAVAIMDVLSIMMKEVDRYTRYTINLGSFKRSFAQVMEAFDRVSSAADYDVMYENCQTWIVTFLLALDVPVPEEVETIARQVPFEQEYGKLYRAVAKIVSPLCVAEKE